MDSMSEILSGPGSALSHHIPVSISLVHWTGSLNSPLLNAESAGAPTTSILGRTMVEKKKKKKRQKHRFHK